MDKMKAIVLAAGEGSRLRPFTEDMPKVMIPIANKPILEHLFNALIESGIRDIGIVVGYKKESIMDYFGDGSNKGLKIEYIFQDKQLGTGHALIQAKDIADDEFLVLPGDNIIDAESIKRLLASRAPSIIVEKSREPSKYGVVEIEKENVVRILEKPTIEDFAIVSTGIYKLNKKIFAILDELSEKGVNSLTDAINVIAKKEPMKFIEGKGGWKDAVYPWDLIALNSDRLTKIDRSISGEIWKGVIIRGSVIIDEDTVIHSNSYIMGPAIIGRGCEIGPNVCIFPYTSIGDDVTIHPFTEVRNSIIMRGTSVGSNSSISDSIVGENCRISSHFSIITGDTILEIEGEFHKLEGVGSYIGSGCKIGSHVIVEPGSVIGKGCEIYPNKVIKGNIPSQSRVI